MITIDDTNRDDLKELIGDLLKEIIKEAQYDVVEDPGTDTMDIFDNVSLMVKEFEELFAEHNYSISPGIAYSILADMLLYAMSLGLIGGDWSKVIELFQSRAAEFAGGSEVYVGELKLSPRFATEIVAFIVGKWADNSEHYESDGEFTDAEKIVLLRSMLIAARNRKYLPYDKWLKTMFVLLDEDWRLLGGGWPSVPSHTGPTPWSQAGGE